MAATTSVAMKHWARIIKQWPVDRVRPAHVQFQKVMQSRLQKLSSAPAVASKAESNTPGLWNEKDELRQANALYALLENRFEKEYPIPQQVRYPKSNVAHYDDIVKELDEAPSRSWFTSFWNRLRGSVRVR